MNEESVVSEPTSSAPADFKKARRRKSTLADPSKVDRQPPHSVEAEQGVLGCILHSADCIDACQKRFAHSGVFYDLRHRAVYEALATLRSRESAIDLITLQQHLRDNGELEAVGGLAYLAALPDATPSAANLDYYVEIVVEKFRLRQIIGTCMDAVGQAYETNGDIGHFFDRISARFFELSRVCASESPHGLPAIEPATALMTEDVSVPEEIVEGLLHRGTKMVLGGSSKVGKTWIFADLALSVASGEPWLSLGTTRGRVLYINLELPRWSFRKRLEAIARAKSIRIPENLELWNLRGHIASFDVLLPQIKAKVIQSGYSLIILDPIYKLLGQLKENEAGDIGRLLNEIEKLAQGAGAAVAIAAHFSKGSQVAKESIDRISGSGVFARDPDSIIVMTKHEEENAFTVESTLRNLKPVDPFVVRWLYPLMRRDDSLDPAKLKQPSKGGRTATYTVEMLTAHMPKKKATTSAWRAAVCVETGMSQRQFYTLLKQMKEAETIEQKRDGTWSIKPSAKTAK